MVETAHAIAGAVWGLALNVLSLAALFVAWKLLRASWRYNREDAKKGWGAK